MATNPRQTERSTREAVEETFRNASDTGYDTTRRATEQTAQTMADVGRQATTATADAARENAERASDIWRSESAFGGRIVERSMEQFSGLLELAGGNTRHTMERCFHNLQAITESGNSLAEGFRKASAEWMAFTQNSIGRNLNRVNALMGCRSMDECVAVQTELARENLDGFLQTARRTSEISAKSAQEAARSISQASLAPKKPV
jgi:hypothetical protein